MQNMWHTSLCDERRLIELRNVCDIFSIYMKIVAIITNKQNIVQYITQINFQCCYSFELRSF